MRPALWAWVGSASVLFLGIPLGAADKKVDVIVAVEMTAAGRKFAHPSVANPAYYYPVLGGFKEMGALTEGAKEPPPLEIARTVARSLAGQGYLVAKPGVRANEKGEIVYADGIVVTIPADYDGRSRVKLNAPGGVPLTSVTLTKLERPYPVRAGRKPSPADSPSPAVEILRTVDPVHGAILQGKPTFLIYIHWGYMNPDIADPGEPISRLENPFFNEREMTALVGFTDPIMLGLDSETIFQSARDDRYFIVLSVYDFEVYLRTHKKVLLWQAKMSVPSSGTQFQDVMSTLMKAGGPLLGREMVRPQMLRLPVTPEGHVSVGVPVLRDYEDAPVSTPTSQKGPAK